MTRPRAASSSYACETVTSAQPSARERSRIGGEAIAGDDGFVFDRIHDPVRKLHVERARVARLELQRFEECVGALRRLR